MTVEAQKLARHLTIVPLECRAGSVPSVPGRYGSLLDRLPRSFVNCVVAGKQVQAGLDRAGAGASPQGVPIKWPWAISQP